MLAARLLWRNLKSGELKLLCAALMLAVTVVSTVSIFTERLELALTQQSNSVLGADAIVQSSKPIAVAFKTNAEAEQLQTTPTVEFGSMVMAGDAMQLASIRAVAQGYPLRGEVEISDVAFTSNRALIHKTQAIPAPGEVWLDSRLLPLLNIQLGDTVTIGEANFIARNVIISEPNATSPFSFMNAGLMMNLKDLPATQVIQPGSRVQYQLLLAGEPHKLEAFLDNLKPALSEHEKIVDISTGNRNINSTLVTGRQFLLLAAVMGVLLAGIAIAQSARQFATRHTDQVALLKSFGISSKTLRALYLSQLTLLALLASCIGLFIGEALQRLLSFAVFARYDLTMPNSGIWPYAISLCAGLMCLLCFALPALWHLPSIAPIKILRRELTLKKSSLVWQVAMALFAVLALTLVFSRNFNLAASVFAALACVLGLIALCAWALLQLTRVGGARAGNIWRLALANLFRRLDQTLVQLVVFSIAILLLVTMIILRTSLIHDWQMQVPEDAPNHFLVNIASDQVDEVRTLLDQHHWQHAPFYPMVRGRLSAINDLNLSEMPDKRQFLNREANLTWAESLGTDNKIEAGLWWDNWQKPSDSLPGVSVEQGFAEEAGIHLGDRLEFSIGGLPLSAQVVSLRSLDWRSMQPNFFFIFEPGSLEDYAPMYMTSFYLPATQKALLHPLIQQYPTMVVIELDKVLHHMQTIISQVSNGILLVLLLIIAGGALVILTAVNASLSARKQEVGVLRALGASRQLMVNSIWLEFSLLGAVAGLLAIVGAEILLLCLQHFVLQTPIQPHWPYWILTPVLTSIALGLIGNIALRGVIKTPAGQILREV